MGGFPSASIAMRQASAAQPSKLRRLIGATGLCSRASCDPDNKTVGATQLLLAWAAATFAFVRVGPPNGSDAKLHGQGPRAEARAARGAPACEARECAPRDAARF